MVETDQKFEISLIMPEDTLTLAAPTAENKMEWFVNLQKCILNVLGNFSNSICKLNLRYKSIFHHVTFCGLIFEKFKFNFMFS